MPHLHLLVEDHAVMRADVSLRIERLDDLDQCKAAQRAEECLEEQQGEAGAPFLGDIPLPRKYRLTLTERVHPAPPGCTVAVVSTGIEPTLGGRVQNSGVSASLAKPAPVRTHLGVLSEYAPRRADPTGDR